MVYCRVFSPCDQVCFTVTRIVLSELLRTNTCWLRATIGSRSYSKATTCRAGTSAGGKGTGRTGWDGPGRGWIGAGAGCGVGAPTSLVVCQEYPSVTGAPPPLPTT